MLEHPLETPTCYIHTHAWPLAALPGGISEILHCHYGPLCCGDFMVNKPAWRKPPVRLPQKKKKKGMTHSLIFFFHGFTLFCQPFNFPSFQEAFVSSCANISLQSGQPLFETLISKRRFYGIFWLTTGCNHLTQNTSKWVSSNVTPGHVLLRPSLQASCINTKNPLASSCYCFGDHLMRLCCKRAAALISH